jgi:hypothetical protein
LPGDRVWGMEVETEVTGAPRCKIPSNPGEASQVVTFTNLRLTSWVVRLDFAAAPDLVTSMPNERWDRLLLTERGVRRRQTSSKLTTKANPQAERCELSLKVHRKRVERGTDPDEVQVGDADLYCTLRAHVEIE